jgi:RNA polymerase sigma-70 factor (ECF subfamily)
MQGTGTEEADRGAMARLAAGEDRALDELMERHSQPVFHFLVCLVQDEAVAEDLAQETFVRVYRHRGRYDPKRKFTTWLYAIAANLGRDRVRWLARHPELSLDHPSPRTGLEFKESMPDGAADPGAQLESEERAQTVRRAVAALPEELRTPLILTVYEERSQAEVADILGCSVKAIEMRIYRARHELRRRLQELLAGG